MSIAVPTIDPRAAYEGRLIAHRSRAAEADRDRTRLGWGRVAIVLVGLLIAGLILVLNLLSAWLLLVPVLGLVALSLPFGRAAGKLAHAKRAIAFHERGLARLDESWRGKGEPGTALLDDNHLYAPDLDIFGIGSLFERMCEARTRVGQETLAIWLRAPADPDTIRGRQSAVADLRSRLDLREQLAVLGQLVPAGIDTAAVANWAIAAPVLPHRTGKPMLHALTLALGATLLL